MVSLFSGTNHDLIVVFESSDTVATTLWHKGATLMAQLTLIGLFTFLIGNVLAECNCGPRYVICSNLAPNNQNVFLNGPAFQTTCNVTDKIRVPCEL